MTLHVTLQGRDTFFVTADTSLELEQWLHTWVDYARVKQYKFIVEIAVDALSATARRFPRIQIHNVELTDDGQTPCSEN